MASHDEDTMPEETQGYKLSQPKQSLADYQKMDAGDESLQRYKESLGLGGGTDISDPRDPRVCIILSLTMESPGRDPVTIDLSAPGSESTLKDPLFCVLSLGKVSYKKKKAETRRHRSTAAHLFHLALVSLVTPACLCNPPLLARLGFRPSL
jgi:Rho GDP-dissociation inhibitor